MDIINSNLTTNLTHDTGEPGEGEGVSLEDLLPTICQVFVTIFLGWLTGTLKIISPEGVKGLNIFVGKFSLPSLVFISLATLDFSTVNLAFLLGIFLSKLQIFLLTIFLEMIISRDLSKAAMFAMFCTQTNDFAMGVPILEAIGDNPYKNYLYLAAPISLVVLNPVGFIMLETQKESEGQKTVWSTLAVVMKGLATNAIIVMTVLGCVANLIFSGSPPAPLQLILSKLGAAFGSLAPFTLGLGMVDKFRFLRGGNLSTLIIMMIIKCILAPISSHFPPALGVRAYASQYGVTPELVSAGIVLCTAVSAPLMFLSAQILTILSISSEEDQLSSLTRSLDYHMAIFSMVGVSVILTIFLSRRHAQLPHCFTTALLVQSLVAPLSAVLIHHDVISPSLEVSPQSDSAQKNNKCKWSQHSPCNISNGVSSVLKKTVEVRFKITLLL